MTADSIAFRTVFLALAGWVNPKGAKPGRTRSHGRTERCSRDNGR